MPRRNDIHRIFAVGLAATLLHGGQVVHSQGIVDCVWPAPIHLSRIVGKVVDPSGVPIPDVNLTLWKDSEKVVSAKSADDGTFRMRVPSGTYLLRAEKQYFDSLHLEVHIGNDMYHFVRPSFLNVILGMKTITCTWATTSRAEFEHELQHYKSRVSGTKEEDATQK
ncbi:MAG TPA: carboxypeptidase-like regulatory domain-containing protein [Terracidiphilus sp.]|nr:carboxypeptidase-like regulatory domain-containing protein [Terracidiphilus sp.]